MYYMGNSFNSSIPYWAPPTPEIQSLSYASSLIFLSKEGEERDSLILKALAAKADSLPPYLVVFT